METIGYSVLGRVAVLNLSTAEGKLSKSVSQLSSGLRVETAADDPSGYAIAQHLEARVNAFNQATSNAQTANIALAVADGALANITNIIQRICSLAIEANDDFKSDSDRSDLQSEVAQLLAEINRIADDTNFNGKRLFGGSESTAPAITVSQGTFSNPNVGANNFQYSPAGSAMTALTMNQIVVQLGESVLRDLAPMANTVLELFR